MNWFKNLFRKRPKGTKIQTHEHTWIVQYRTGDASAGKSDVVKCNCGQWAVYHRNPAFGETHKYLLM